MAERSSLVRLQDEYDVDVDWRGFELHPDTPRGGQLLADRFGPARVPAMKEHLRRFAAAFGVEGMRVPDRVPNTRRALALAEWARAQGRLAPLRDAVMAAHWRDGKDIEDAAVLAACAGEAGLDPASARAAVDDPAWQAKVDAMGADAARAGVTGIPTLFIGPSAVVGCQPWPEIAAAAEAGGAARRG
ncbi:MAG TPA: DsbA family protein [Anaeromyxobacteraceae bacterium]|nr:DsbA family protein [Anaeromyxobacteraceae bacterium]